MENKTILITGSTDGIGKETAKKLAEKGAQIIIHGRNEDKIYETLQEIKKINNNVFAVQADFSDLNQVKTAAKDISDNFEKIDILFNNAAEFVHEKEITKDGLERQFQVNYLAHFLLTEKLMPLIKDTDNSKILNISSMIHASAIDFDNLQGEKNYSGSGQYALTKLLNILHTYKLARKHEQDKVKINCLHPGVIETKLLNAAWSGGMPVSEGAENLLYAAESEVTSNMSGLYLENRRPMQSNPVSYDTEIQDKLYDLSLKMTEKFL
ncbi:MAG: SDR family oxidoreductase [Chlorobi bacterium]|nr:SDR family oxidoreductase [Chlorobiota bacterium]